MLSAYRKGPAHIRAGISKVLMWYSNDAPTPQKSRPRTYVIACDNDLTEEDFDLHYKWAIRNINSRWATCKFLITSLSGADDMIDKFLRDLGVSPARIIIYHMDYRPPTNTYQSATRSFENRLDLEKELMQESSHDILYTPSYVTGGMTERLAGVRREKQKTNPWIDMMPDV